MIDIAVLKPQVGASVLGITTAPATVAGIKKLVQRYAILLLCGDGTVKFAEDQGGPLVPALLTGAVSSEAMLRHLFNITSHNAVETMHRDDADAGLGELSDDERLESVTLNDLRIDATRAVAYLDVTVTSVAGGTASATIPIG